MNQKVYSRMDWNGKKRYKSNSKSYDGQQSGGVHALVKQGTILHFLFMFLDHTDGRWPSWQKHLRQTKFPFREDQGPLLQVWRRHTRQIGITKISGKAFCHPLSRLWSIGDSNPWPPHCQCGALPTALMPRTNIIIAHLAEFGKHFF